MKPDLPTARAALASMAAGMSAKQAAAEHGVTESWAAKLVTDPPAYVRDAAWYRAATTAVRKARAQRFGKVTTVKRGARGV